MKSEVDKLLSYIKKIFTEEYCDVKIDYKSSHVIPDNLTTYEPLKTYINLSPENNRYGIELYNYYKPKPELTVGINLNSNNKNDYNAVSVEEYNPNVYIICMNSRSKIIPEEEYFMMSMDKIIPSYELYTYIANEIKFIFDTVVDFQGCSKNWFSCLWINHEYASNNWDELNQVFENLNNDR